MSAFKAEIISIGNEVLAGYTVNTNAAFIGRQLLNIGLPVYWINTIRDERQEILNALKTAARRANAVLITGGLGPTPDDITKSAICEYFDVPMVVNQQVLEDVKKFVEAHGHKMSETSHGQALIPDCDYFIRNQVGTAPGLVFRRDNTLFYFMPGVPAEMRRMVSDFIVNDLAEKLQLKPVHTRLLRTTGIPESFLYNKLKPALQGYPQIEMAFLPREIGVDLRFRLIADEAKSVQTLEDLVTKVRLIAGKYIFADKEIELEEALGRLIAEKKLSLATAESFTGGLLGDLLTNIPGSSSYFLGGMVTYSNESKIQFLDVQADTLKQYGAVSEQTALEMVRGVQRRFASDCALATTGIAGPTGATAQKPVGLCYIAARYGSVEMVKEFHFGTQRLTNKKRGAAAAMEMLRRLIPGKDGR